MPGMADLISINEARGRALAAVRPLAVEDVPLDAALGRVLAADVTSAIDVPPFDPSAMDGYAVIAGPAAELRVVDESRAGHPATARVEPGQAIRISTGAPVPDGATAVVPVEDTEPGNPLAGEPAIVRVPATEPGDNVRRRGEDVRVGDIVAHAGTVLGPAAVGALASVGVATVRCAKRPRVGLLVTGDELTEPGQPLGPGGIYSSNGYALGAQVAAAGAQLTSRAHVRDSASDTRGALERALAEADVVIVSGGVSVGPHDHVKGSLAELGVEERFWGVALQPGKPTWFGVHAQGTASGDAVLVFGLPGNPVSAMVTFVLFVRPVLAALQGADPAAPRTTATLGEAVARRPNRDQAVRVTLSLAPDGRRAIPTGPQGSHILSSLTKADALALVPAGPEPAPVGETVEIEPL
jgi:molybdopterin molybdotransferase